MTGTFDAAPWNRSALSQSSGSTTQSRTSTTSDTSTMRTSRSVLHLSTTSLDFKTISQSLFSSSFVTSAASQSATSQVFTYLAASSISTSPTILPFGSGARTAIIVLSVAIVFVTLAGIFGILFFIHRRRKNRNQSPDISDAEAPYSRSKRALSTISVSSSFFSSELEVKLDSPVHSTSDTAQPNSQSSPAKKIHHVASSSTEVNQTVAVHDVEEMDIARTTPYPRYI